LTPDQTATLKRLEPASSIETACLVRAAVQFARCVGHSGFDDARDLEKSDTFKFAGDFGQGLSVKVNFTKNQRHGG
jgi:hypothetical protein